MLDIFNTDYRNLFMLDKDVSKPKQLPPTEEMIRTTYANLKANSHKPFHKGAFKKKLSRKQRRSKR